MHLRLSTAGCRTLLCFVKLAAPSLERRVNRRVQKESISATLRVNERRLAFKVNDVVLLCLMTIRGLQIYSGVKNKDPRWPLHRAIESLSVQIGVRGDVTPMVSK